MKKQIRHERSATPQQEKPDIADTINAIQRQLAVLERKLDTLISQSPRFEQPRRYGETRQDSGYRERTLYKVICADCNKECEVPFRPSGDRPVYCKECFSRRKNDSSFKEKRDNKPRDEEPAKEHFYDRFKGGKRRKSGEKKKASFRRRK